MFFDGNSFNEQNLKIDYFGIKDIRNWIFLIYISRANQKRRKILKRER